MGFLEDKNDEFSISRFERSLRNKERHENPSEEFSQRSSQVLSSVRR